MKFKQIKPVTISEKIAEQIENNILEGALNAGDKLPPERELAIQFDVSRPSIREAINKLQARGLVTKNPGGGTYIDETVGASFSDPLLQLIGSNPDALYDILELRFALEGLSAYGAAERATEADKKHIIERYKELEQVHQNANPQEEAIADVNFHLSITEASHNPVLLHIMRSLFHVLQQSLLLSFQDLFAEENQRKAIPEQHMDIMQAVLHNDKDKAKHLMQKHIAWVESRIANMREEKSETRQRVINPERLMQLLK